MDERFPIENAADYSARIQAGLVPHLKYITAEEVFTEFSKRCANGMQYTTFPNEITDEEIAKKLGISRSYVSRIEKRALTKMLREFIKNKSQI